MGPIILQADNQSNRILFDLAKKLGANVLSVNDEQMEDFALGALMEKAKTNVSVSREKILQKLKGK